MNYTSIIGIIAGLLTSSSSIPQIVKIIKEKKVADLSMSMFITLSFGVLLWTVYGILRDDMPIIVTNGFSFCLNITILILRFKYKKAK